MADGRVRWQYFAKYQYETGCNTYSLGETTCPRDSDRICCNIKALQTLGRMLSIFSLESMGLTRPSDLTSSTLHNCNSTSCLDYQSRPSGDA